MTEISELLEVVSRALNLERLSVVETAHLKCQIVQHTTQLKWRYDRYTSKWTVEKRTGLENSRPYTFQRAKLLVRNALNELFKTRVFVRTENIQDHRQCRRPLVAPGESIFVILNSLPEFHASPITVNGCQYITVTQVKKFHLWDDFISAAGNFEK